MCIRDRYMGVLGNKIRNRIENMVGKIKSEKEAMYHAYLVAEKELVTKKPRIDTKGGETHMAGYDADEYGEYKDLDIDELETEISKRRKKARDLMDSMHKSALMKDPRFRKILARKIKQQFNHYFVCLVFLPLVPESNLCQAQSPRCPTAFFRSFLFILTLFKPYACISSLQKHDSSNMQ
eukprot:TRINITY_DN7030_c0_g1_i2.p1 TRINITY_DN7030_c0_g1~~TRINITY_DN7030_c0_g1_i2.p1  ORF type:complete len:204 (+),score=27.60 TRINITY_DN7030_c0_g1_i2:75-614(+)